MPNPDFFALDLLAQGVQDAEFIIDAADLFGLARFVTRDDGFAPGCNLNAQSTGESCWNDDLSAWNANDFHYAGLRGRG